MTNQQSTEAPAANFPVEKEAPAANLSLDMNIPAGITPRASNVAAMLFDVEYFAQLQRIAGMFSHSALVPKTYQNVADCAVAIHMAYSAGIDPLFLLQNTQVVHGVPGWKGTATIALINNSKRFAKNLDWVLDRNNAGEVVKATCFTEDAEGNRKEASVTWDTVTGEGWDKNKGSMKSKWVTMREQMFCYRSATFFARRYCSDILLGLATEGERNDIVDVTPTKNGTFGKTDKADALNALTGVEKTIEGDNDNVPCEDGSEASNGNSAGPVDASPCGDNATPDPASTEKVPASKGPSKTKSADKPKGPLSPTEANGLFNQNF